MHTHTTHTHTHTKTTCSATENTQKELQSVAILFFHQDNHQLEQLKRWSSYYTDNFKRQGSPATPKTSSALPCLLMSGPACIPQLQARWPEASPIPTTKLKQPALHWAQVVSVRVGLTSDLDWPALATLCNAFFPLTCRARIASIFFFFFMILMKPCAVEQVFC